MNLKDLSGEKALFEPFRLSRTFADGPDDVRARSAVHEHTMLVYLQEEPVLQITCTPQYLCELVLGRLLTGGMIRGTDEVDGLYICAEGSRAKVWLKDTPAPVSEKPFAEPSQTCCGGNRLLTDRFCRWPLLPVEPVRPDEEFLKALAGCFAERLPLREETSSVHSCFLVHRGAVRFACEDIGRHNALDKAVGHALLEDVPLRECALVTSGRMPLDMTEKAIRAGVSVLAGRKAPTAEAAELARRYGLTLLEITRRDGIYYWTDPREGS